MLTRPTRVQDLCYVSTLAGNHSHSARSTNLARNSTMSHASYGMGAGEGAASYGVGNGNGNGSGGLGAGGGGGAGGKAGGAPPRSGPSGLLSGMFGGGGGVADLGHGADSFSRWVGGRAEGRGPLHRRMGVLEWLKHQAGWHIPCGRVDRAMRKTPLWSAQEPHMAVPQQSLCRVLDLYTIHDHVVGCYPVVQIPACRGLRAPVAAATRDHAPPQRQRPAAGLLAAIWLTSRPGWPRMLAAHLTVVGEHGAAAWGPTREGL